MASNAREYGFEFRALAIHASRARMCKAAQSYAKTAKMYLTRANKGNAKKAKTMLRSMYSEVAACHRKGR